MVKSELRRIYLRRQRDLLASERSDRSERVAERFFGTVDLKGVKILHCFISIQKFNELDTSSVFEKIWHDLPGIEIVVPRVDFKTGEMRSVKFGPDTPVVSNRWDIDEPVHDDTVAVKDIDLVLVPGLCFDLSAHRVGYGKGFYDRFLATCRPDCRKIGLSYFEPVDKVDDAIDTDVRMDRVITPFPRRAVSR